jgi:phosphoribosyl-ATP pyrophosphohydrolase
MELKGNLEYWKISLKNPEPIVDEYYISDEIIVDDKKLIKRIERLRDLITTYCVLLKKGENLAEKILDEIYEIISDTDKIQYTEFVAFWKTLDLSFSVFNKLQNQKIVLAKLLKEYCSRRKKLYDRLGYSNITVQALYDIGASRKKGTSGVIKIIGLAKEKFNLKKLSHFRKIEDVKIQKLGYFLPDSGDQKLFRDFCKDFNIRYKFGDEHQGKLPDVVLKVGNHFLIIEAKHIKESGGAQDKQIDEIIKFIKYSENSKSIHYLSFLDGIYFNNFISPPKSSKVYRQKQEIEEHLKNNPNNFFLNTAGIICLFQDLKKFLE